MATEEEIEQQRLDAERKAADEAKVTDEHAKSVIARANAQAKREREAREAADLAHKKAVEERDVLKKQIDDAAAEKLKENNQFKELAEKLAIDKAAAEKALADEKDANAKRGEEDRKAREAAAVRDAVEKAAIKAGIIDEDLVSIFDLSTIETKDGKPTKESVDAFIEAQKTAKPKLFEEEREPRPRNDDGTFRRPEPQKRGEGGKIDWSKLSAEEFAEKERELIRART